MHRLSFAAAMLVIASQAIKITEKAKCPFGFDQQPSEILAEAEESSAQYVSQLFDLRGAVRQTKSLSKEEYDEVAGHVVDAYEAVDDVVQDNENRRGRFVACLLRVAGHDFMDFRHDAAASETGGSDGCINLNDPDNKGIEKCLTSFGIPAVFDKVKNMVSFADFLVIAG